MVGSLSTPFGSIFEIITLSPFGFVPQKICRRLVFARQCIEIVNGASSARECSLLVDFAQDRVAAPFRHHGHAIDALDLIDMQCKLLGMDRVHGDASRRKHLLDYRSRVGITAGPLLRDLAIERFRNQRMARLEHFHHYRPAAAYQKCVAGEPHTQLVLALEHRCLPPGAPSGCEESGVGRVIFAYLIC